VSFVLDELTHLNGEQFGNRLDPNQSGVFGYSFGGTTALALAGATIDRAHLQQDCNTRSSLINISLLYQCQALVLPPTSVDAVSVKDDRIQAVYVFVPFSRSLYGPQGMAQVKGPLFWEATDLDVLTPLVVEQLPAFSWLTSTTTDPEAPENLATERHDRYLAVTAGLPHARLTLDTLSRLSKTKPRPWEEIKPIAEGYHQMLSTAFFQVHLANDNGYRAYLQASGAQHLSQAPYTITLRNKPLSKKLANN
jgi:predicted dienelactone hydrolase